MLEVLVAKKMALIGGILFLSSCGTTLGLTEEEKTPAISEMQVHFIDVGQGDATLVTCDKEAMLIDAGDNSKGTTVQLYLKKQGINNLKYLILTHPDADHIGGADVVVTKFDIDCDVYKAGHHGSKTASSKTLLEAATPSYVVISCAEGNSYGHPHAEPMNHFRSMNMKLFRTDEQGSIVATSNGKEITWNSAPSGSWLAGENTQSSSGSGTSKSEAAQSQNDSTTQFDLQPEAERDSGILVKNQLNFSLFHRLVVTYLIE